MMDIPESPPLRSFLISCIFRNVNSSSGSGNTKSTHHLWLNPSLYGCSPSTAPTPQAGRPGNAGTPAHRCFGSAARGARSSSAGSPPQAPGSEQLAAPGARAAGCSPRACLSLFRTGKAPGASAGRAGPGPVPRRRCRSRSRSLPPQRPLLAPRGLRRRAGPGRSESLLG